MKRLYPLLIAALLVLAPASAFAANCSGTATGTAAKLTMPSNGAGSNGHRNFLQIQNLSTDSIGFSELTITPVIGNAGTWTLGPAASSQPGMSWTSTSVYVPQGDVYIIGGGSSDAFTCVVG